MKIFEKIGRYVLNSINKSFENGFCPFHKKCELYQDDSVTCNKDFGSKCGKYNELCDGTRKQVIG